MKRGPGRLTKPKATKAKATKPKATPTRQAPARKAPPVARKAQPSSPPAANDSVHVIDPHDVIIRCCAIVAALGGVDKAEAFVTVLRGAVLNAAGVEA